MEGDAGTRRLNPTDADDTPDESVAVSEDQEVQESPESAVWPRRETRLGRGWMLGICAALVVLAAAAAVGGYLALRHHSESEAIARAEAAAVAGGQGLCRGHPRPGHGDDDRRPDEDHRMLHG